jgi:hypothetical protein
MKYSHDVYVGFYKKNEKGPHGLSFDESLEFITLDKNGRHDYFQWLFPTNIESTFNKLAPDFDQDLYHILKSEDVLKRMILAAERFLDYVKQLSNWPSPTDHNNLRFSRMLRSLNLVDLTATADEIYLFLLNIHFTTSNLTLNNLDYFRSAMFDKTFFVISEDEQQFSKAQKVLNVLLPDHKLMRINEDDAKSFKNLYEPVIHLEVMNRKDSSDFPKDLKLRGKTFRVDSSEKGQMEKYFITFRYWY